MSERLPKGLNLEALALSPAENRAFPRWYTDLLLRKRTDAVAIGDVLTFVDNFGIASHDKNAIMDLFAERLVTVDPPQFYVFLRLTGHLLQGKRIQRELAFVAAPVPRPRPILTLRSKGKPQAQDMDSFMSLMTGGGVKKKKRVTFDSRPPQVTEAAHRSMSELLRQHQLHNQLPQIPHAAPPPAQPTEPDPDPEPEVELPINNQFAKLNIESVLHNGTSTVPTPPAPRKQSAQAGDSFIYQLTQNTGPQQYGTQPQFSGQSGLQQQGTGVQQQGTGLNHQGSGLHQQGTGLQQQSSGLQQQGTGLQSHGTGLQPQMSGLQPNRSSLQQQASGFQPSGLQSQGTGFQPQQAYGLQAQTTGQFGLAPQGPGHLNNIQPQGSGQFQNVQPQNFGQYQNMQPQSTGQFQRMQPQVSGQFHGGHPQQGSGQLFNMPQGGSSQTQGFQTQFNHQQNAGQSQNLQNQGTGQFPSQQVHHPSLPSLYGSVSNVNGQPQLGQQQPYHQNFAQPQAQKMTAQSTGALPLTLQKGPPPPPSRLAPPSFQSFADGLSPQGTGLSPSHSYSMSPQPSGVAQQQQMTGGQSMSSMPQVSQQFVGDLSAQQRQFQIAPPPQFVQQGQPQPYNMQALRDQVPNW